MDKYFHKVDFRWRGLGDIPQSGMGLRSEYDRYNAEKIYDAILPKEEINDHKLCICGDILKGKASPAQCSVFSVPRVNRRLLWEAVWSAPRGRVRRIISMGIWYE
jgi:hydrogenase expression/formation protein HypD